MGAAHRSADRRRQARRRRAQHKGRDVRRDRAVCCRYRTAARGDRAAAVADVDEAKRLVLVRDRKDPRQKAGNDQWVPLLGEAWMVLKRQPQVGGEARIFPIGASTVSKYFTEACMKMSIPDLHFHDLRHEGTSQLFEEGYEIQQVALVTGHKDWRHLRRYRTSNLRIVIGPSVALLHPQSGQGAGPRKAALAHGTSALPGGDSRSPARKLPAHGGPRCRRSLVALTWPRTLPPGCRTERAPRRKKTGRMSADSDD